MPRFFFNLYDGQGLFEEDGANLKNYKEMCLSMITPATEIPLSEELQKDVWQMEILDDHGKSKAKEHYGGVDMQPGQKQAHVLADLDRVRALSWKIASLARRRRFQLDGSNARCKS